MHLYIIGYFLSDSSGTMIYILLLVLCSNDNQKFFLCSL